LGSADLDTPSTGPSVTVNLEGVNGSVFIEEWSNVATSSPLDRCKTSKIFLVLGHLVRPPP
jgi:hypothetical protein